MNVIRWDGQPISKPGIYSGVPMDAYHGADLCAGPSISSSGLRKLFNESALALWVESPLNPRRVIPPDKEAWILGRGGHHLILGEADFHKHFVIRPSQLNGKDWNGNRTDCKEWLAAMKAERLQVLTPGQIAAIRGMAGILPWQEGLDDSGLANTLVVQHGALRGLIEHTIIAQDPETGIWLKSRPDAIPTDSAEFADFKSTTSAALFDIQKTVSDYRYDMQAALAAQCLRQAAGIELTNFSFIFAEKAPPHATQVVELKPHDMEEAAADNRAAINLFAHCLKTGKWPGPNGRQQDAVFVEVMTRTRERALARRTMIEMEIAA